MIMQNYSDSEMISATRTVTIIIYDGQGKENSIQDSPNEGAKTLPVISAKAIRKEGERREKNYGEDKRFES